jgi:hypothetical protein
MIMGEHDYFAFDEALFARGILFQISEELLEPVHWGLRGYLGAGFWLLSCFLAFKALHFYPSEKKLIKNKGRVYSAK